jgi:protein-L-isoaspartate(D-aspartate) O-methyltransferase
MALRRKNHEEKPADWAGRREAMVRDQVQRRGIDDPLVIDAMLAVPRERFVPARCRASAYEDRALPIPADQTISQPFIVARMIHALRLRPGDRVLEIGCGSGYAAAVMSEIVGEVFAVEREAELVELSQSVLESLGYSNVRVKHADGTTGWPEHAPFDAISVAAGGPDLPGSLVDQLAPDGRMIMPVGSPTEQELVRAVKQQDGGISRERIDLVRFVPLVGEEGWEG